MNKEELIRKLIGCSLDNNTINEGFITVAKLETIEKKGLNETIDLNTAIIPSSLISRIKASHVNLAVKSTGVNYDEEFVYTPSFWLYLSKSSGLRKAEPLVISWSSANNTTFVIDQGFLSTFKLTPRLSSDKIHWDDLSRPKYEIIQNKLVSKYDFPKHSEAYVKINKEYLERYLYLRKKIAVHIFTITKDIYIDEDIIYLLNEQGYYIEEFKNYEVRIHKLDKDIARLEINGYKVIFDKNETKDNTETLNGHHWKGVKGIVTNWRARHEMPMEYIYVSDDVLNRYENDPDYQIYPNGSVKYENQWGISHCERIGKNGIKIEIKKLYEGTPNEVIEYWNKFSIDLSEIIKGEGIVIKSEKLIKEYLFFGSLFSKLANQNCEFKFSISDIVALDQDTIEHAEWSVSPDYKSITNRIDLYSFTKEQFLSRCKKLNILLIENIKEKNIRGIVNNLGFSEKDTQGFKGIKLVELVVKYLYIAENNGLNPITQKETIVERVIDLKEFNIFAPIFALNNLRQLDAHKTSNSEKRFYSALGAFGVERNSINNNYAKACEQVYDSIYGAFNRINALLADWEKV